MIVQKYRRWTSGSLLGLLALSAASWTGLHAADQEVKLPLTADDSICCDGSERTFNQGGSGRVKMKGIENLLIFNFESDKLKGERITKATLHIKGTDDKLMVRHVGLSTIASPWAEGTQNDKAKDGEPCLLTPKFGTKETWAGPESNFLDVYGGRGGTLWVQTYVEHDKDMWFTIDVDPRLIEACAAGLSYGICMTDDNGQTGRASKEIAKDGNSSNNYFFAHEQNNAAPYLTVTVQPKAPTSAVAAPAVAKVEVKPWLHGADMETGGVEITWPGPKTADDAKAVLGYRISISVDGGAMTAIPHWQTPAPVLAGEAPRALLRWVKPGADIKAQVEVVSLGQVVSERGEASGKASPAFPASAPLTVAKLTNPAGAPPTAEGSKIWVLPDCTKANPITGNVMEEKGVSYEGDAKGNYSESNCVWSGANKTVSLHSLRGEWVAFQVVCQNKDTEVTSYSIKPGDLTGPDGASIPAAAVELSWMWYQHIVKFDKNGQPILPNDKAWYADPLVPLKAEESFTVPNKMNAIDKQQNQTVYVEFFVPKDAKAGAYKGMLEVSVGKTPVSLTIALDVHGAVIPNETHFTWSMNAYSSPGGLYGKEGSAAFNKAEQDFYKMSHLHRADLAVLHYSHTGRHDAGTAPEIAGSGKTAHVKDWSDWDERFGPELDGSLFKGTPREGTGMSHFYLDLCEHYPMPMTTYKWNDVKWEEHWKVCGPVAEDFPQEYQDAWVAVAKDYIKHAKDKKYLAPLQIYLNDKYFYKQYDEKKKDWGKGVCFWLLDEPQQIDDFEALAFFGQLMKQAQEGDRKTLYFRVDVSRPEWGRTYLDRVVDLNVSGGFGPYRRMLEEWRERYGQIVWTYGGAPSSEQSALGIDAQALDLYSRGVDGFVPWLTLGGPENWTKFVDTTVFYTGKPVGVMGPCSSLRLKAYRRGEQDVEYVYLLAAQRGLLKNDPNRRQVAKLLGGAIQGTKKLGTLDAQGAVTEDITGLSPDDFERLRIAIANELK